MRFKSGDLNQRLRGGRPCASGACCFAGRRLLGLLCCGRGVLGEGFRLFHLKIFEMKVTTIFQIFLVSTICALLSFKSFTDCQGGDKANHYNPVIEPSVSIRLTTDGNISALVKDNASFPKTVFYLQTSSTPNLGSSLTLTDAHVEYSNTCVVFISRTTGESVVFKLIGSTCSTTGSLGTYEGNGLIKQYGDDIYNDFVAIPTGPYPSVSEFSCKCNTTGISASDCTSGGIGATACSTNSGIGSVNTGCSVTCGTGFYACCID